jgi:dUTP pyrophosphatase
MKQNHLKLATKLFDTTLPLPEYKTSGAAAFDLYAREETTIPAHGVGYVPLNIALQLPPDHFALLAARSSLHKKGLMMANGIGVGDFDYRGDGDEYKAALYNFTDQSVVVERGERIVQLIVLSRPKVELLQKEAFTDKDRGGFGSTGKK